MAAAAAAAAAVKQLHPKLLHLFCFNPIFDTSEATEHEKLLYFWPPDVAQDAQMKAVGLVEAMIKYSSTFSKDQPCEVVHTKKARMVFYNPEPNFWLSLAVTLPFSQKAKKDGPVTEYHDENVQNVVLHSLLRQTYTMYKLFNGTFTSVLDAFNRQALVDKLELFFPQHIETLDLEHSDVVEAFNGIQFLPLDKNTFLKVQSFVNLTESKFPSIHYTVFVYHDHLIWSGLEQEDMRVLYKHLTQGLPPLSAGGPGAQAEVVGSPGGDAAARADARVSLSPQSKPAAPQMMGFLTGPEDLKDPETPINAPRLFVTAEDDRELHLVTYACDETKMCFLVDADVIHDLDFYRQLAAFVGESLLQIERELGEQHQKRTSSHPEVQYKYLYFNHMNLAQKSSFMTLPKKCGRPTVSTVSPEYIRYLTDMHTDFTGTLEESEIILKTEGDCWIVGRQSDQRQFFVILAQKNANLIEINEEIRRLSSSHFGNIFMVD
mmetsp:Transcript_16376/g.42526  ORF Transcript_16376/g.42526 Transcript_16376/m.42526 type:complete len:490 (+) Transcript_16376:199-1668(+)|eukprot:CAMPEP_0182923878 /NCGR_PEP_ID=MMETSP0105_2-20130417/5706_1 /TAXON_ID=81532 ORGANISM="Acanthoeca-like sp., Strain 10tr" /NCGR_SAMPLE_ID=MMETSP0105_2 /ASSEMBLY_ACC=CAM_ASM_000205 /LENGTH=489 /DNA_ID=CAMNT_0025061623 /DNA_START=91 /DNA_END=1560 /DNA_ORIENTATION=+